MRKDTWRHLNDLFGRHPSLRGDAVPQEEVEEASRILARPFPPDYADFLVRYGAAIVGSYPIFGLRVVEPMGNVGSVIEVNDSFRAEHPQLSAWLVVSNDLAGNPIGVALDGSVLLADTELNEVVTEADRFEDFLRRKCLRLP